MPTLAVMYPDTQKAINNPVIALKHPNLTSLNKSGILVDKNYVSNMLSDEQNPQQQPTQKLISNNHEVLMTDRREAVIMSMAISEDIKMEDVTVRVDNDIVRVLVKTHKQDAQGIPVTLTRTLASFWLPSVVERHLIHAVSMSGDENLAIIMPKKMTPRKNSIGFDILVDPEINEQQRLMMDGRFAPDEQEEDMSADGKAKLLDKKLRAAEHRRQLQQQEMVAKIRQERMRALTNARKLESKRAHEAKELETEIAQKQLQAVMRRSMELNVEKTRLRYHNARVETVSPEEPVDSDFARMQIRCKLSEADLRREMMLHRAPDSKQARAQAHNKQVNMVRRQNDEQFVASRAKKANAMALKLEAAEKRRKTYEKNSSLRRKTKRIH